MLLRETIAEHNEDAILFDEFESAIVGLVETFGKPTVVCYDKEKCIKLIQKSTGGKREEAEEYFEFNVIGSYLGDSTPVFLTLNKHL
jgi:hypothetical protein